MRTGDITVTPYRGRNALKSVIEISKINGLSGSGSDKNLDELKIRLAKVVRFYPGSDKLLVKFLSTGEIVRCKLLHSMVSGECNISFMPIGTNKLDTTYNEASILPINPYYCAVLDINPEDNKVEYGVIGFLSLDKTLIKNNAESGEYLIENDTSSISLKAGEIHIKSGKLFYNDILVNLDNNQEYVTIDTLKNLNEILNKKIDLLEERLNNLENNDKE